MISLYKQALTNWSPSGRSSRSEFWAFVGVNLIIYIVLFLSVFVATVVGSPAIGILLFVICFYGYAFVTFWPTLALNIRRWHDFGASAALILIFPIGGILAAIVPSNQGPNRYGEQPGHEPEVIYLDQYVGVEFYLSESSPIEDGYYTIEFIRDYEVAEISISYADAMGLLSSLETLRIDLDQVPQHKSDNA